MALCRYMVDLGFTRLVLRLKGEPSYELKGSCCGCGGCCTTPMIHTIAPVFYLKSLRALFLKWHRVVNGFELLEERRIERTFVFKCTHYDPETKQCDSYSSRPGMCRDYPKNVIYYPRPEFIEGCSYKAIAKDADDIEQTLAELDLPPDKLEKVRKEFFLDDEK
jgi:Fe-S-cluster containining protein